MSLSGLTRNLSTISGWDSLRVEREERLVDHVGVLLRHLRRGPVRIHHSTSAHHARTVLSWAEPAAPAPGAPRRAPCTKLPKRFRLCSWSPLVPAPAPRASPRGAAYGPCIGAERAEDRLPPPHTRRRQGPPVRGGPRPADPARSADEESPEEGVPASASSSPASRPSQHFAPMPRGWTTTPSSAARRPRTGRPAPPRPSFSGGASPPSAASRRSEAWASAPPPAPPSGASGRTSATRSCRTSAARCRSTACS